MKTLWLPDSILYDGTQLRSRWIEEMTHLQGNAIVSFRGAADVSIQQMVDLEDVARNAPIYSEEMLHFIVEHFDHDLERMILRQRLFIAIFSEELKKYPQCKNVERRGNDIYDGAAKLSVSVATSSPVSCLIHTGINISSRNTPLPTKGLADYDIDPKRLSETVMKRYISELESVAHGRTKVRPVT